MILVTGGAGFIGSNFVLDWLAGSDEPVVNLDKLTYAGNLENLASLQGDARHVFVQGDLGDCALVDRLLAEHRPRAVLHFAAESHATAASMGPRTSSRPTSSVPSASWKPCGPTGAVCPRRKRLRFVSCMSAPTKSTAH